MSTKRFFWKVWLKLNLLTKDVKNDYIAEVSTVSKTLHNDDIAQAIKDEGAELHYETLLDILNRGDRIRLDMIAKGYSVQSKVCRVSPRVLGNWTGANATFSEDVHKITLDITPTAEAREALSHVGIEVLGVKDSGAYIGLVTDTATGKIDGTITAGDDVIIEGEKIRISPDGEDGIGVFFVSESGEETPVTHRFTQNDPKKVIARVPSLAPGSYTLEIRTRFSQSTTLLNEVRILTYNLPLTVA